MPQPHILALYPPNRFVNAAAVQEYLQGSVETVQTFASFMLRLNFSRSSRAYSAAYLAQYGLSLGALEQTETEKVSKASLQRFAGSAAAHMIITAEKDALLQALDAATDKSERISARALAAAVDVMPSTVERWANNLSASAPDILPASEIGKGPYTFPASIVMPHLVEWADPLGYDPRLHAAAVDEPVVGE